jgi:hypothetical protein
MHTQHTLELKTDLTYVLIPLINLSDLLNAADFHLKDRLNLLLPVKMWMYMKQDEDYMLCFSINKMIVKDKTFCMNFRKIFKHRT